MKPKFCQSSVADGQLPVYCGWIRVWLLKPPLHRSAIYVFRSVCGIFTRQPNSAVIMATKGLRSHWIWFFFFRIWGWSGLDWRSHNKFLGHPFPISLSCAAMSLAQCWRLSFLMSMLMSWKSSSVNNKQKHWGNPTTATSTTGVYKFNWPSILVIFGVASQRHVWNTAEGP